MTEDEAKTKWCPFRGAQPSTGLDHQLCIASACMAWRKEGSKFRDAQTGNLHDYDFGNPGTIIDLGFCGLAGKP